jgi:murein DD-endopeptidase MepM/ murein hydrolase activator NlpD
MKFRVTQTYKKGVHDGLDLVGIDRKDIHSTIRGTVIFTGWENTNNHKQGFGKFIKIKKDNSDDVYYFGHLSEIYVKTGDRVYITQVIGKEGSTGNSTGSHCHYCIRKDGIRGNDLNVSTISGIPNRLGVYDDGYRESNNGYIENSSYKGNSIVDALKQIGVDSSFEHRKKLAERNNITNYRGTPEQNTKLLNLLKQGKLKK